MGQPNAPHNYRTVYATRRPMPQAPRAVAPPLAHSDDGKVEMVERGAHDAAEPFFSVISSEGWMLTLQQIVLPYVANIRTQLLRRPDLDDTNRQRLVGSLLSLEFLLEKLYLSAGEKELPQFLRAAFK